MRPVHLLILAASAVAILTGCAGSAVDTDFRRKVSGVDFDPTASYDPATGEVTAGAHTHFTLRNPDGK